MAEPGQGEVPTAAVPPQEKSAPQGFQQDEVRRTANEGPGPVLPGRKRPLATTPELQQVLAKELSPEKLYYELHEARNEALRRLQQELGSLDPGSPEALQKQEELRVVQNELERLVESEVEPHIAQRRERTTPLEETILIGIKELVAVRERAFEQDKPAIQKEIREKLKELMGIMPDPEDTPIVDEILVAIAQDEAVTEEFLSKLIVLDLEDQPHQIRGFYGQINFQKFLRLSREVLTFDKRQRLLNLIEANSAFHNMNYIIRKSFEQYSQQSEGLLPKHFEVLSQIPGVDTVIRLYEQLHQETLAREMRIAETEFQQIDLKVEEIFKELVVKESFIKGMAGGEIEEWEIFRALIYGKNFFRVLVRAAEHTALSELPEWGDPSLFVSSPQKQFTQILNTLKFIGFRFKPEEPLGGPELLTETLKYTTGERRKKERQGAKVRIKTLQGTDVDMREFQGIIAARGVMASWRNAEIALRQIKFYEDIGKGQRLTNVVQFFLEHKEQIKGLKERSDKKGLSPEEREKLKEEVKNLFAPLLNNTSIALGLLVSPSGLPDVPTEFKELIWEKIAELDPLLMASLLSRLEVDDEIKDNKLSVQALEDILLKEWGTPEQKAQLGDGVVRKLKKQLKEKEDQLHRLTAKDEKERKSEEREDIQKLRKEIDGLRIEYGQKNQVLKGLFEGSGWEKLSRKLRTANELRIKNEAERLGIAGKKDGKVERLKEAPKDLNFYLISEEGGLDEKEKRVLKAIRENGKLIVSDLARINQSYAWTLNDTPFASLNWVALGQFYDRQTGDLANFNKGTQGLLKIIGNPFGKPIDETLKEFEEAITGEGAVLGRQQAQDNQQSFFRTWLSMMQKKSEWQKQVAISTLFEFFRQPMSRAQEIVGMNAPALDEDGTLEVLDKSLPHGITRKEVKDEFGKVKWKSTYDSLLKEFHASWPWRLWGKVRDWGPFGIIAFLIALFKSITKGAKQ